MDQRLEGTSNAADAKPDRLAEDSEGPFWIMMVGEKIPTVGMDCIVSMEDTRKIRCRLPLSNKLATSGRSHSSERTTSSKESKMEVKDPEEIRVTLSADQLMPPIGAEVTLNRADGTRMPVILDKIEDCKDGTKTLVFRKVVFGGVFQQIQTQVMESNVARIDIRP